jgi:hypothetical protein
MLGAMSLWAWSGSSPWWVGGAFAAIFFGKAALSIFQLVGELEGRPAAVFFARGFRGMAIGYIAAGCILGVGALWQRRFFGFLVGYGALSFAWVWFFVLRKFSKRNSGV